MEMTIEEERENPFLETRIVMVNLKHENAATPSKAEIIKILAAQKSLDEGLLVVDYVITQKGIGQSKAKVKILKEKPEVKKVEAQASAAEQASQEQTVQ
jgi:ribosomal protein S24E